MKTKKGVNLNGYTAFYEELESVRPSKLYKRGGTRLASITKLFSIGTNGKAIK